MLNHEPDTARFSAFGFVPSHGNDIRVYLGDVDLAHQLFGGIVLSCTARYDGKPENVFHDINCIDYTWLLNRRKVTKRYLSMSATDIVRDLVDTFVFGATFTTDGVEEGLDVIDEITFTNEDVSDAITRVMRRIGGYWYADYDFDIKAWVTEPGASVRIADGALRRAADIRINKDISQVVTRAIVVGGGANTAADVAIGQTTLPVDEDSWYSGSGGTVQIGTTLVTYGGIKLSPLVRIEADCRLAFARLLRELDLDLDPPAESRRPPMLRSIRGAADAA